MKKLPPNPAQIKAKLGKFLESQAFFVVQTVLIVATLLRLLASDAYYVAYLFVFGPALVCLYQNRRNIKQLKRQLRGLNAWTVGIFTLLFTLMVTLANYKLWDIGGIGRVIWLAFFFIGGSFAFGNILCWIVLRKEKIEWKPAGASTWRPLPVFAVTFTLIAIINLLVLFLCQYPGDLTPDSLNQLEQITTGVYSNHHPFYCTMVIKACFDVGMMLFHDINAAVALYSVFSILVMAAIFAFSVATIAELKAPKWIIVLLVLFYALMPYHIMYSLTMWKDVFFGGAVLLFCIFFFRCIKNMSLGQLNYVGLAFSGLAMCLFRSNGYFAFVFTALAFLLLWKLQNKKILLIMVAVLATGFILKHPVLKALNVTQPDLIESLSIPAQQIARDVTENNDFSAKDRKLLSRVVDVDRLPRVYTSYVSDPVKGLVREAGNQGYIKDHAGEFASLYIRRATKHPFTYMKGWIDETRGYWNAGYPYWRWDGNVWQNDLGVHRTVRLKGLNRALTYYLDSFENWPSLQIFLCIGFFDWLMLGALFVATVRRDKVGVMLTIPVIMIILSLLVATPVFAEFRYAYATFCTLPIVIVLVLRPRNLDYRKETT